MVQNFGELMFSVFDAAVCVMFPLLAFSRRITRRGLLRQAAVVLIGVGAGCHAVNEWRLAFAGSSAPDAHAAFWVGECFIVAGCVCLMVALAQRRSGSASAVASPGAV